MVRVLDALHYAHSLIRADGVPMQIVHRDVSPGNILIDTQGHVKLLDFGIARANEGGEYRTRDGLFKGKLTYAAPEVYEGIVASPRSDVYSAGVVLYQLLAGENPFRGRDMPEIIRRVLTQMPPSLTVARPEVSPALDAAVQRAIAKDPAARFPTAAAFADALRNARTRAEDDIVTELVDDVWNDFNGDMPAKLKLEPLQERDAAWRASQDAPPERTPTLSSTPPSRQDAEQPTTVAPLGALGRGHSGAVATSERTRSSAAIWFGAAGLLLAGIGGVFAFSRRASPEPGADHFVVVEKQASEAPAGDPSASANLNQVAGLPPSTASAAVAEPATSSPSEVAASAAPSVPAKAPIDGTSSHPAAAGGAPDPQALSRTFQHRRGAIEGCFASHATDVDGRPEISVRFHLAPSGLVESADLSPSALSATPLGQCLLGVARGTSFGAQSGPVSFTIPITARRVK
jgi:serine/threonine-protein kinase